MASVEAWERFTVLGEKLGYSGMELRKFVTDQIKIAEDKQKADEDRESRRVEREAKQAEIAAKAQEDLAERERLLKEQEQDRVEKLEREKMTQAEILKKLELDQKQQEQERVEKLEREKMTQAETLRKLELDQKREEIESQERIKNLEIELERQKLAASNKAEDDVGDDANSTASNSSHSSSSSTRRRGRAGPKLPHFDESKDNVDSYLRRFERYAVLQNWPREEWALYLSALLKGKALEVYSRLSEQDAKSYDRLKAALLRKYELTVEGFRRRFYEARRDRDETAAQFVCRIVGYLDRWVQLAQIDETFDGLKALIVKEQFLSVSEESLSLYLRERSPKGLDELVNLADLYLEARVHRGAGARLRKTDEKPFKKPNSSPGDVADKQRKQLGAGGERSSKPHDQAAERVCYQCGKPGHLKRNCPTRRSSGGSRNRVDVVASCEVVSSGKRSGCHHEANDSGVLKLECGCELPYVGCLTVKPGAKPGAVGLSTVPGKANDVNVKVLRDTGCTTAVIRRDLVRGDQRTGDYRYYRMLDGTLGKAEIAMVDIESPYASGRLACLCVENPTCDVIIGNIPELNEEISAEVNAVTTRAQAAAQGKPPKPLNVPTVKDLCVSTGDLQKMQQDSPDLQKWFNLAQSGRVERCGKKATVRFEVQRNFLYRRYQTEQGREVKQLVVPSSLRQRVLSLAHESIMSGHLGVKKTLDRVLSQFAWPGVAGDVTRYCQSCDICQRTVPKGRVAKVPLQKMPIIGVPFQKIGIDLIGPVSPAATSGCRFVLVVVDYATRYPEAVALRGITTQEVAEALCKIYSRVGVPSQIVSDQGSQFMSDVMSEVSRLLSIQHVTTTPYHPQCNGLVERFNGTLKSMLKKLCAERPTDWDRYLEAALFAYREVKQESLGFSPFELLYGRTVRGPMAILRELWSKEVTEPETQTTYEYVFELRNRLEETCKLVEQSLQQSQTKAKAHFDKKTRSRELKPGDKVLILLPTDSHKLLMQWKGPYDVVERIGLADYKVQLDNGQKVFHINMLKRYVSRDEVAAETPSEQVHDAEEIAAAVLEQPEDDPLRLELSVRSQDRHETYADVRVNPELSATQKRELHELLREFMDIFSDLPGVTDTAEHRIQLTDNNPIRCKPYPLPYSLRDVVKSEVDEMCRLGIIEPSESPYSSPLLMVKKKDGTNRPVIDFRRVNKVTIFDAEPMPRADDIYARMANARYFSTMDFCKGYWQIPMAAEDREKTAFSTPFGLFHFVRMPFGLQNAGATYSRMMRRVLDGLESTDNFVDDVVSFSDEWRQHLDELRQVFQRVKAAGLTVKPTKCYFGYPQVDYIGHVVGIGNLRTMLDKTEKLAKAPVPKTKKQLRSFLGLAGYYRKFVPNYATIAAPLTNLTRGGSPNIIPWGEAQQLAFVTLKQVLCSEPVLRLPDVQQPFILRTDASDVGLGGVLLQEHADGVLPVAYISRRLSRAEANYSVVERECLAIVWSISKFYHYLYGRQFVLQTDHRPLIYLDKAKMSNARVMRWALALQPFRYRVESIKGSDNVGADYLSRIADE